MTPFHTFSIGIIAGILVVGCTNPHKGEPEKQQFETDIILPHTPPKQQGGWPAGWIYATLGMIESERILVGDSLELSATYLIRRRLEEQNGENGKGTSLCGTPFSCLHLMERQGALTYQGYRRQTELDWASFRQIANRNNIRTVCDTGFAYLPPSFGLYGAVYTPHDFMKSLFLSGNYRGFISDPTQPTGKSIRRTFPGDLQEENYTNLSPDALIHTINTTLSTGHTLVWMGDTTHNGYSSTAGLANWPDDQPCTPEARQEEFKKGHIRPEHCMQIVGKAHPAGQPDNTYYICRNSAGQPGDSCGLSYLSERYVRMKTVALYRHK